MHRGVSELIRDLNALYRNHPALHELDCDPMGFEWIDASSPELSVFIYIRKASEAPPMVVACNFTPVVREDFRIGLPHGGRWREVLNSDHPRYGGSGILNETVQAEEEPWHGRPASVRLRLPPLAAIVLAGEN